LLHPSVYLRYDYILLCTKRYSNLSGWLHAGMPQLAHSLCVTPQWIQMMVRRLPWFTTPFSAALILAASAWRPSLPVVPEHGLRPALDLVAAPEWQHPATARVVAPLVLYRFVMVGTLMWMKDQEQQSARRRYAHNLRVSVPDHEKNTFECACVAFQGAGCNADIMQPYCICKVFLGLA